jgi:hypothetical protein
LFHDIHGPSGIHVFLLHGIHDIHDIGCSGHEILAEKHRKFV